MDRDSTVDVVGEEHLTVKETVDSCERDFTEVVALARDTDGSSTTVCVRADCSDEVRLQPRDVCCIIYVCCIIAVNSFCR